MADRDARGRFLPGNSGGPGRPPSASVHEHRAALVNAVTPDDIRAVARMLVDRALEGDVGAAKLLFERLFGPAQPADVLERIEELETRFTIVQFGEDDRGGGNCAKE